MPLPSAVYDSPEFARIAALPWRDPYAIPGELVSRLTSALRVPGSACPKCGGPEEHDPRCPERTRLPLALYPIQALALHDAYRQGGLVAPMGTGRGKTLSSLLVPTVLSSPESVLVVPANLVGKTYAEWERLRVVWRILPTIHVLGYEYLSRLEGKEALEDIDWRVLLLDEAARLGNPEAARTIRVERVIRSRREAGGDAARFFVGAFSGTFMSDSIKQMAHIVDWCLPRQRPMPAPDSWLELDTWARALDACVSPLRRADPGALLRFLDAPPVSPPDPVTDARRAFRRRFIGTPGVVASPEEVLGNALEIDAWTPPADAAILRAFDDLRVREELPDGYRLTEGGMDVSRHAKTIALGYVDLWDPWPPKEWAEARSEWAKRVREVIREGEFDSELDVRRNLPDDPALVRWLRVQPTFVPNPVPHWLSDVVVDAVAAWLAGRKPSRDEYDRIAWVGGRAFGERLAEKTGLPYYSDGGLDARGRRIEDGCGPIVASVEANHEGRNLQFRWSQNLIVSPLSSGKRVEQLLARTHRPGQSSPVVRASFGLGCRENLRNFWTAHEKAVMLQDALGPQKLLQATILYPPPEYSGTGPAWAVGRARNQHEESEDEDGPDQ